MHELDALSEFFLTVIKNFVFAKIMISLLSDKKLNEKLENYIQREEEENKKKFYR